MSQIREGVALFQDSGHARKSAAPKRLEAEPMLQTAAKFPWLAGRRREDERPRSDPDASAAAEAGLIGRIGESPGAAFACLEKGLAEPRKYPPSSQGISVGLLKHLRKQHRKIRM